ncbi:response regulator transcription factor [Fulvivirgaceae bacterium PWU5]|uniref:Response regulator transcription factor n=1 Tax=Dawidia cretensis TaxID=2782350 RepID=A0AAP2DSK5_9BACT|nr:response regulator transcription factor [Dawidia cretensis]MBT1706611.1 response regulator transcription factor [Dawidia cretensis]
MFYRKRVVLVDRDEPFQNVLKYVLSSLDKILIVNQYAECADALKGLDRDQPDIIIMDIDFVFLKGPEFIARVKKKYPRIDILVISDYTDEDIVLNVIGSGASGFLLKQSCLPQLAESIDNLMRGGAPLDPFIARIVINAHHTGDSSPLSSQETTVLKLMMKGLTYRMIADELGIAKDTSKTHIKNIYKKLEVNTRAQAVSKAIADRLVPSNFLPKVSWYIYYALGLLSEEMMSVSIFTEL